ncbi:MAG: tetratricopeptide repeat protein, partial [Paludisphaera borealis]|uniref:tetratricopeptide repeat protein n=1 Tax=Paludisphaera borealis TaxID=1387353 RepID=UPI002851E31B
GNEPAKTYVDFGVVFLAAKREDLAIKALERGLVYDEESSQIPLLLADTLLKANKGPQALALVDRYIKRQPQGVEAYELLSKVLKELKQEDQITPRLEAAAKSDSKNVPLQYVLADRYRETGQVDKAEELYKSLLATQPTPETYRALAASLLKRRKAGDLLRVICEAVGRPRGLEAVMPQLQAAASDDSLSEEMLDEGLKQLSAKPPSLPQAAFTVLSIIANPDRGSRKESRLERLLKLQRLMLDQTPNPKIYLEIADTQQRMDQYGEAAATLELMMEKYPTEKNPRYLSVLSSFYRRAGKAEKALETARKAVALEPNDSESQSQLADLLGDLGKLDEAVPILEKIIKNETGNPMYEFRLGGLLTKFGRNEQAVKLFQDMLTRYGSKDDVAKLIHSSLSVIYVNQSDYAKGEAELETALQRFPEDAGVNNDLGYLYAEQGKNLEKAENMIRKALKEDPENYAYLDSLGWVLFKRGKIKDAVEPLEKAIELHKQMEKRGIVPPDATLPEHLGDVYLQLQDVEKAKSLWQEAEKAAARSVPPDKRLAEIRKKLGSLGALDPAPKASTRRTP